MFTTRPELVGTFGMVSSTHWLASSAGMAMLEKGGNAFDAAVAAGMVLQVAEPHLNGPGGDLPLILHRTGSEKMEVICGQGPAPAGATLKHYKNLGLDLVPGTGLLATVIPGAFDAWMLMLRDHGTLSLAEVFEPALHYASQGIPVLERIQKTISYVQQLFREEWPSSAEVFLPGNEVPEVNQLLCNPVLAKTWSRIIRESEAVSGSRENQIDQARKTFYQGFVAEAMERFCLNEEVLDNSGRKHKGVLNGQDLAGWEATYEAPLTYHYAGLEIGKCGTWSQGPVQLQTLALLNEMGVADWIPVSTDFVHGVTEALKLAFADREAYYGDPNFVEVPLKQLLSREYNLERSKEISDQASLELRPGKISGFEVRMPEFDSSGRGDERFSAMGIGEPTVSKKGETRGDTCHVDVVDRWGNMVSATPSGGWLQSSPVIPELGFCLNSRAQMFWLQEGLPATLAPGKRPRTTLTPSMALRDGKGYLAYGTPGGDQQDQWQAIFLLRHLVGGMNLQEAIDAPSFHTEHFPESFFPRKANPGKLVLESRFEETIIRELEERGHRVQVGTDWSEGRMCAVSQKDGLFKAAANPRGMQGYAVGR
ncbi:MAG: gamma-glutamyltransferase family protein [bacterium]